MKLPERFDREYRLLALAVMFFLAGGIFFWYDASLPRSPSQTPGSQQAVSVQSPQSGDGSNGALDPDFANYPPPAQFATFSYAANGINGSSTLPVNAICHNAYIAVLVFPSKVDYRGDIDGAVYNKAFPCHANQAFALTISTSDIATAPFGNYYLIVADQGTSGTWYNPR